MVCYPTDVWKSFISAIEGLMCEADSGECFCDGMVGLLDNLRGRMLRLALMEKDGVYVDAEGEA